MAARTGIEIMAMERMYKCPVHENVVNIKDSLSSKCKNLDCIFNQLLRLLITIIKSNKVTFLFISYNTFF